MPVVVDHDRGALAPASLETMTAARTLGGPVAALTIGAVADDVGSMLAAHGAAVVHRAHHELLGDYGPETWGEVVAQAVRALEPVDGAGPRHRSGQRGAGPGGGAARPADGRQLHEHLARRRR